MTFVTPQQNNFTRNILLAAINRLTEMNVAVMSDINKDERPRPYRLLAILPSYNTYLCNGDTPCPTPLFQYYGQPFFSLYYLKNLPFCSWFHRGIFNTFALKFISHHYCRVRRSDALCEFESASIPSQSPSQNKYLLIFVKHLGVLRYACENKMSVMY